MKKLRILVLLFFGYTEAFKRAMTEKGFYFFTPATKFDLLAIAQIADLYFGSTFWENEFQGRLDYFKMLFEKNPRIFSVLRYYSPYYNKKLTVGYIAILPEKRRIVQRHLNGTLNEYHLSPYDILDARTLAKQSNFVLYVQAVAVLPQHRRGSKETRDNMFAAHLTEMMKRTSTQSFSLFAESSSAGFEKFATNHGFYDTEVKSPHKRKIFRFDSTQKKMAEKGKKLVNNVKKLRKRISNQ